jgi:TPR repeat protein
MPVTKLDRHRVPDEYVIAAEKTCHGVEIRVELLQPQKCFGNWIGRYKVSPFHEAWRHVVGKSYADVARRSVRALEFSLLFNDLGYECYTQFPRMIEGDAEIRAVLKARMGLGDDVSEWRKVLSMVDPYAEDSLPEALYLKGTLLVFPPSPSEDCERGVCLLRKAAALGDASAMETLSSCYASGWGVDANERKRRMYMRRALRAGLRFHPSGWNQNSDGLVPRTEP